MMLRGLVIKVGVLLGGGVLIANAIAMTEKHGGGDERGAPSAIHALGEDGLGTRVSQLASPLCDAACEQEQRRLYAASAHRIYATEDALLQMRDAQLARVDGRIQVAQRRLAAEQERAMNKGWHVLTPDELAELRARIARTEASIAGMQGERRAVLRRYSEDLAQLRDRQLTRSARSLSDLGG